MKSASLASIYLPEIHSKHVETAGIGGENARIIPANACGGLLSGLFCPGALISILLLQTIYVMCGLKSTPSLSFSSKMLAPQEENTYY
jgi:hypothetical protein